MKAELTAFEEYAAIGNLRDRERIVRLVDRFMEISASKTKVETMRLIAAQEGIPYGTLRRLYYVWRKKGVAALADRRRVRTVAKENEFYSDFKVYAERDLNTSQGGYDAMLRDIRAGKSFMFGTWRDCYRRDFPFEPVPALCPANYTPRGFTYQNMMRLQKVDATRAIALAWSRQGQFAALKFTLPVLRSRVGLHVGEIIQSDDVWHNFDVYAAGFKGVFNPLEFAFYDIASGYKVVSAIKPRVLTTDPKTGKEVRDNLKEFQYRMAVAFLMCVQGFYKGGVTLIGERGTTALRETVLRRIAAVPGFGKLFRFDVSGVKNTPAHKGLFMGNAGGNPRMKALCECAHNIMHNATASLLGNHGRDAAHLHESNAALVKYSTSVIEEARAIDPAIIPLLQLPVLDINTYPSYFYAIQDTVMDRTDINLEGWEQNWTMEYRLAVGSPWRPVDELKDMNPDQAAAIAAVLATDRENLMRQRKMSRREVWKRGQKDLVRWPIEDMPAFLDPRDAREGKVAADGTISFTDSLYYPGQKMIYVAQYTDRRDGVLKRLAPGQKVRFYWNPLGTLADHIWLTDEAGAETLGMCPVYRRASWADPHSIKEAMGRQQAQIAELMAETHARGEAAGVARLAAEKVNAAIIAAAKEQAAEPPRKVGVKSADVLGIASEPPACEDEEEPVEEAFNPLAIR